MKCAGQAMIEFAVAAAALSMLLLGMPVIARYHTLQLASIEGARELAFMSSWRPAGVGAGASYSAGGPQAAALRTRFFPEQADHDQASAGAMNVQVLETDPPGVTAAVGRLMLAPFWPLQHLGSGFDLHNAGLHRAQLDVAIVLPAATPEPFADIPMAFHERYTLLGDGWSSAGPGQVATRAGGLVLTRAAQALQPLVALGADVLMLIEPALRQFCPGLVNPEILPSDRLGPAARTESPTLWRAAC
jgi:hypothetical protein